MCCIQGGLDSLQLDEGNLVGLCFACHVRFAAMKIDASQTCMLPHLFCASNVFSLQAILLDPCDLTCLIEDGSCFALAMQWQNASHAYAL